MTPTEAAAALVASLDAAGASPGLRQRARLLWRDVAAWTDRDSPRRDGRARGPLRAILRRCEMYEAVIGYTEDEEIATWGAGETADAAIHDAVERFIIDAHDCIEPGDYEATVYDEPMTRDRPDGDSEVYEWRGRGRVTVTITSLDYGVAWTAGAVSWDYTATEVTP